MARKAPAIGPNILALIEDAPADLARTLLATRDSENEPDFALPVDVEDYGSGAVELMGPDNLYVTLLEFGPESLGQPLFSAEGIALEASST